MRFEKSTRAYERWLRRHIELVDEDLELKYARMAEGLFLFFRATFYRWAAIWSEVCPELGVAPAVLAVGDLHVENFGTWRDADGRLVWGVNDNVPFDFHHPGCGAVVIEASFPADPEDFRFGPGLAVALRMLGCVLRIARLAAAIAGAVVTPAHADQPPLDPRELDALAEVKVPMRTLPPRPGMDSQIAADAERWQKDAETLLGRRVRWLLVQPVYLSGQGGVHDLQVHMQGESIEQNAALGAQVELVEGGQAYEGLGLPAGHQHGPAGVEVATSA